MDKGFLARHLTAANCAQYLDIFLDNEIDPDCFRKLTESDLRILLPGKMGLQKAVMEQIRQIEVESLKPNSEPDKENEISTIPPVQPETATIELSLELSAVNNDPQELTDFGSDEEGQQILELFPNDADHLNLDPSPFGVNDEEEPNSIMQEILKYRQDLETANQEHVDALEMDKLAAVMQPKQLFNLDNVSSSIKDHVKSLPIFAYKDQLIKAVTENQMVIVVGETGSGKSTQIPKYLLEAGFSSTGRIGCTQPRRVATKALANRVSMECGTTLGEIVGYVVRFDKRVCGETVVKYMTDGILLKELGQEPNLDSYSVIIVDEAHERSIHTDVCFGLLKQAASRRPDLKIIVSSATLDSGKFSSFFNNAPVFHIPGKVYPVEIIYNPKSDSDYIQGTVDIVLKIHKTQPQGDVLVFLSGQDEIESAWDSIVSAQTINRIPTDDLLIVPCYGALSLEEQDKIFESTPVGCRKIVLATNIAETSLTVDGIVYVVDSGRFKQNEYNSKTGIDSLVVQMITKAQATQRTGRAGRTRHGQTYRLYSEDQFQRFKACGVPEIQRSNVESVVLQLSAMGVVDVLKFDFMDAPNKESVLEALEHLQELDALDSFMRLTALGRRMSEFPLDPPLSKILITSAELGCSSELLSIVALMSIQYQSLFSRGRRCYAISDAKKSLFNHPEGDHLSLLKLYSTWVKSGYSQDWCRDNYVQYRLLADAEDIRIQLADIMHSHRLPILSCGSATIKIRKAICSGFFRRLAMAQPFGHHYHTFTNSTQYVRDSVFIHPASALFPIKPLPQWVIYHEVVKTKKAYMRAVVVIEPVWLKQYAPTFFKKLRKYPEIAALNL